MSMIDLWTFREETIGDIDLTGYQVEAADGGIGKVEEATYETGASYMVVDTGPWIFGRKVVLPAGIVDRIDTERERVSVSRTKDEIKRSPELDLSAGYVDSEHRDQIAAYYGEPAMAGERRRDEPTI